MIYTWKPSHHLAGDPQVAGEHLERLRLANGGSLAVKDVVVDARDDNSPLHRYFEWRDNVAAAKYREEQASKLIRGIVVIHEDAPDVELPAYVSIGPSEESFSRYQPVHVAMADSDSRDYVLKQALSSLRAWRKRYGALREFTAVVAVIDDAIALDVSVQEEHSLVEAAA